MRSRTADRRASRADIREKRRQSILETAAKLFAAQGYADCDMERLAAECGVAKGTLYLYFPGKQELFFACTDWGMRQLQESVRAAAQAVEEPFERIGNAIRAYLAFFDRHPEYVELLIQERAIFKDRKQPTYFAHREANVGYWRDLYRRLRDEGRVRQDIGVDQLVDTIGSLLYGTMFLNHFIGRKVSLDEQYAAVFKFLLGGILGSDCRGGAGEALRE